MKASTLSVRPDSVNSRRTRQRKCDTRADRAAAVAYESLESRQFFSAVAWTGAGDGVNWSDPANWSINAMPAATDDVTISVAANPNIQVTGNRSVHSLSNAESLTLTSGATLTTAANATSSQNITLNGGTISGGVWTFSGGTGFSVGNATNLISGAAISGDLFFSTASAHTKIDGGTTFTTAHLAADNASIGFTPSSTLAGTILFEGAGTQSRYVEVVGTGTLTIGATGTIKTAPGFAGIGNVGQNFWYGGTMTLNNGGLISAEVSGKTVNLAATTMTNSGTLRALNGATLNFNSTNWSSSNTISATDSTLNFTNTWSNSGTLNINNSTLSLGGNFTTAGLNLAGFIRTGGTVNLTGTLNNASSTLSMDSTTGTWNLAAGTISGGQLSYAAGQTLNFTNSSGTLNNVAINGDLSLVTDNAHVALTGSSSFNAAHLLGNGTSIGFGAGYTLNAPVWFEGPATGARYVETVGAGTLTIGATGSIRTAAGFAGTSNVGSNFWFGGTATLTNNGLIRSDISNKTLNIGANTFTNNGALEITNGTLNINSTNWTNAASGAITANGSTVKFNNTWSNPGTLSLTDSPLTLGGTFSTSSFNFAGFSRTGTGAVDLTGTLNNASATLTLNSATGTWNLLGGTVNGGQITSVGALTLVPTGSGGTLNNVVVNGDITLDATNAHVKLTGATTFDTMHLVGNASAVAFEGGYTLNRPILFEGSGTQGRYVEFVGGSGAMTIDPAGSITTAAGFAGIGNVGVSFWYGGGTTLNNNGLIRSNANGRTLNIAPATFNNNGTTEITNGTLNISSSTWTNAATGTISATGSTVSFTGAWSDPGALNLVNTTLTLGGTFSTSGFNFAGVARSGGAVNLTGTLNNAASTLTLNSATGTWNLLGGTINGGQLNSATAQTLALTASGGVLNNVAVTGDIFADAVNARAKLSGTTSFNALHLAADNVAVGFDPGYTLNSPILFEGPGTQGRYVELTGTGTLTIGPSGSIKSAAGFAGTGNIGPSFFYGGTMTLDDQGLISAEVSGKTINVKPTTALNISGTTQVLSGGILNIDTAGPVTVAASGNATASHFRVGALTIAGAAAVAPAGNNNGLSIVNSLTFNGSGYIDFNDNDLMLNYTGSSPLTAVQTMINTGRNAGAWNGVSPLRSSSARNVPAHNTTLAAMEGTDYKSIYGAGASFDTSPIGTNAVLVKYTYYGDAEFNGKVNFDDYVKTDNGFNNHRTGWTNGDYDGNGQVNFDDYVLIDLAFNTQGAAL